MSYIEGRKNILSIISNSVLKNILEKNTLNSKLLKEKNINNLQDGDNTSIFFGMPNNLSLNTTISVTCGDSIKCKNCLDNNQYKTPEDIKKLQETDCFGLCSCNISNVNLLSNLLFSTGINVNLDNTTTNNIYSDIKDTMSNLSLSETTTTQTNWLTTILVGTGIGILGGGLAGGFLGGIITKDMTDKLFNSVDSNFTSVIKSISILYNQSINQLIVSSQILELQGSGIKVHNISLQTLQDINMAAIQNSCSVPNSCIINQIDTITNAFMASLISNEVNSSFVNLFTNAFQQNKKLIIYTVVFILSFILLYIYFIIKKALSKKS